jgi:ribosomal protein S18 acetylase RimI-like enzyme
LTIEFRKAVIPGELRSLAAFDRKIFASDHFPPSAWRDYESYWMLLDHRKIGCCSFEEHVDFQDDLREDGVNPPLKGSLYISTTGILPRFRGMGFGTLLKSWQIAYARYRGFSRIVTNTRKRNAAMIALNRKFHFKIIRTTPRYYEDPPDSTVVMELPLSY